MRKPSIRRRIRAELKNGCRMTATQLAACLGESPASVSSELRKMYREGTLIEFHEAGPRGGSAFSSVIVYDRTFTAEVGP